MMQQATQSLSVRRAWIEMNITLYQFAKKLVALRKESVDRNDTDVGIPNANTVALRKESVDRNLMSLYCRMAWTRSLSVRRAWIEIWIWSWSILRKPVALRKESVDRNV